MATIALRMPTALPGGAALQNGNCYVLMEQKPTTVRTIIQEKIRAELRKIRAAAGSLTVSSLPLLLPDDAVIGLAPLDEQLAIAWACRAFKAGRFLLLVDGLPQTSLDTVIGLTRATSILFVHVPAAASVAEQPVEEPTP